MVETTSPISRAQNLAQVDLVTQLQKDGFHIKKQSLVLDDHAGMGAGQFFSSPTDGDNFRKSGTSKNDRDSKLSRPRLKEDKSMPNYQCKYDSHNSS
jgi:hypothetical protein